MLDFGLAIPQTLTDGPLDKSRLSAWLRRVESLGFHSVWAIEQVLGAAPVLESLTTLSFAAALTDRLRLGVAVLIVGLRQPVLLAKQLSSLDVLSQGRLIVGVGLGGNKRAYPVYGLDAAGRVERFVEGLEIMQSLWTESHVTRRGRFAQLESVQMEPKPRQKPHPPLWFGGHHPNALARAVRYGDGFIGAGSVSIEGFLNEVRQLQGLLAGHTRAFTIGKRVYLAIDDDRERARQRLRQWFGAFYGRPDLADEVAVFGPLDEVVSRIRVLVEAGTQFLLLHPVFDEAAHLERLAAEVIPRLQEP